MTRTKKLTPLSTSMGPGAKTLVLSSAMGARHSQMMTAPLSPSHSTVRIFNWQNPYFKKLSSTITGSVIYIFGDKKNDHGIYSIALDTQAPQFFDGVSGCGGAFGLTCEQQLPSIKYLASNLDDSLHTVILVNHAGVNHSFFGISELCTSGTFSLY